MNAQTFSTHEIINALKADKERGNEISNLEKQGFKPNDVGNTLAEFPSGEYWKSLKIIFKRSSEIKEEVQYWALEAKFVNGAFANQVKNIKHDHDYTFFIDNSIKNSSYPIISYPEGLSRIQKLFPENVSRPIEPTRPIKPILPESQLLLAIILSILGLILTSIGSGTILAIGIFLLVLGLLNLFIELNEHSSKEKKQQQALIQYEVDSKEYVKLVLPKYQLELKKWEDNQMLELDERIKQFRLKKIKEELKEITVPQKYSPTLLPKKGTTENFFFHKLQAAFPRHIHNNLAIFSAENSTAYLPDFTYHDPEHNLLIDIEIDEPYTADTLAPIHCYDSFEDSVRDNFFTKRKWIVIRFCEEQVVSAPERCIQIIATVQKGLVEEAKFLKQYPDIKNFTLKRWSKQDSLLLAQQKGRDKYLVRLPSQIP